MKHFQRYARYFLPQKRLNGQKRNCPGNDTKVKHPRIRDVLVGPSFYNDYYANKTLFRVPSTETRMTNKPYIIYHSDIPEGVAETSQLLIRDIHILPLPSYEE
jgi:hypothetical protein